MTDEIRLEVGRVDKAHGLRGEVVVTPISDNPGRFDAGAALFLGDRAILVRTSRRQGKRLVLALEGVEDRDAADAFRGVVLTADAPGEPPSGEHWVHELVGCRVESTDGLMRGTVESVQENPAHDLLVLDTGALVPVTFIVEHSTSRVVVEPPEGLFDL